MLKYASSV